MRPIKIFTPGRLLILGDHSDWVGSFNRGIDSVCIEALLKKGIHAKVTQSDKFEFIFKNKKFEASSTYELQRTASSDSFFKYVAGTAIQLFSKGGIKIKITKMDLPIAKGLASSAAVCVLVAQAYNKLYNLQLSETQIMEIAFNGEHTAGSKCGKGDQIGAFYGKANIFKLVFNNNNVSISPIKIRNKFYFLIADLNGKKDTKIICSDLQRSFNKQECIREFLEKDNTYLCHGAKESFEQGIPARLGYFMNLGLSLFDKKMAPYSFDQLESPILHKIVNDSEIQQYIFAGKGTGAQGDGSIQLLCKNKKSLKKVKSYLQKNYNLSDFEVLVLKQ